MKIHLILISLLNYTIYFKSVSAESTYETKYADILIDHFSYTRNDTFKLKYLINDTFWSEGGPIFFYTGNEGDIELFYKNTGFVIELAPQFDALIVFCEHRYYGSSMPFGNLSYTSPKYLGYLSSEQALQDFVDVIDIIQRSKYGADGELPVITFGGSYGGMLAAWMRIKYPASVLGAIAASAPVWQFTGITPCGIFNSIVTNVFSVSASHFDCSIPIKNLWPAIRRITSTSDGMKWFSSSWKLCKNITKQEDVQKLIDDLTDAIGNLAMVNYPYPSKFLADLPAYPVKFMCSSLKDYKTYLKDDKKLIQAVGIALNVYSNYSGNASCNDFSGTEDLGTLGWDFQSCTEMVMPMCSEKDDIFETTPWDFQKYSQDCLKKFGVEPINPREVILQYGGKNIRYASNIVFSNGLLDPWSGGGVLSNISKSVTAIIIPEGAHHLDLRSSNPADPSSVIRARKYHADSISKWLRNFNDQKYNSDEFHKVERRQQYSPLSIETMKYLRFIMNEECTMDQY